MAVERTISSSQLIGMSGARGGITAFARPLVSEPCQALVSLARNAILTLAAGCPSRRSFRQFTRFSSIVRTMVGLYKPGSGIHPCNSLSLLCQFPKNGIQ